MAEQSLRVSIVISAVSGERVTERCIESLKRLTGGREIEWIVKRGEPSAVFRLRAEGIRQATGDRIVVLGDRYEVTRAWADRVWGSGTGAWETGPVGPGEELSYWGWGVYLSEYAHIAPPVRAEESRAPKDVAGGNVLYSASTIREAPQGSWGAEWTLHAALLDRGIAVAVRPELEVRYAAPPEPREYLAERFWLSKTIGAAGGVPKLLFAPVLPFLIIFRIARFCSKKPGLLSRFLATAPVIFLLAIVQAAGEFRGALQGSAE